MDGLQACLVLNNHVDGATAREAEPFAKFATRLCRLCGISLKLTKELNQLNISFEASIVEGRVALLILRVDLIFK